MLEVVDSTSLGIWSVINDEFVPAIARACMCER